MPSRFHHAAKILLAASPGWAVMPAALDRVPVGHVITATHGLLRQRVQCIGPLDIGGTDFPCLSDMLWRAARYQDVRANHPRRSLGQAGTSCPFKSSHGVNAGGGGLSGPDVDDGSIHVYQIDLRANANATEYPTERPLDCGWPDLRRHLVHVDADEFLAGLADRFRNFVLAKVSCGSLLFPRPAEQPNDAFGLNVCLRLALVSKIRHECGADCI